MEHYLLSKAENYPMDKIKNEELINLMEERDALEVGTEVTWREKVWGEMTHFLFRIVEIDGNKIIWKLIEED